MKPFKDQGWLYYDKCKTIMYASKAQGGRAFFAGVGSAITSASQASSSSKIATAFTTESTISDDHGTPATDLDPFIKNFGEIQNMTNTISSLYMTQSQLKPAFPLFGHAGIMGENGEVISVSSSSYSIKRSHDSMTSISPSSQSLSSQPEQPQPTSMQSASPSPDPSISNPLPPTSPLKKRSKGSKASNVIAPPTCTQKEKLTTAVAVNGMQGTINRMTDMLATVLDLNALATAFVAASASAPASVSQSSTSDTSMAPAQLPAAAGSSTASDKRAVLQHLKHNDNLTHEEKARLLNVFTKYPAAVETYLEVLDDDVLRLGYAHELLKDI